MTIEEAKALLKEARGWLGHNLDCLTVCNECSLAARIDEALAASAGKSAPADLKWREKGSNRHGISPKEADYSDSVFLTVEQHWLNDEWLFRVEYADYAKSEEEAKTKAVDYAGRLP